MIFQLLKRSFAFSPGVNKEKNDNYGNQVELVANQDTANLITSVCDEGMHAVTIDLDVPAVLIPSAQPGHSHLFIEKKMTWEKYTGVLWALKEAGLIEPGYYEASINRGYTAVRVPGKQIKMNPELNPTYLDRVKEIAEIKWEAWLTNVAVSEIINHKKGDELSDLAKQFILANYISDEDNSAVDIISLISDKIPDLVEKQIADLGDVMEQLDQLAKALANLEEPKPVPVAAPEEMLVEPVIFEVDPELEALLDEQAALMPQEIQAVEENDYYQDLPLEDEEFDVDGWIAAQVEVNALQEALDDVWNAEAEANIGWAYEPEFDE